MGTIEDKLKYLAKTKVDLMNALKAKGAPIDESTPLSEYDVMVKAIKGGAATEVFNSIEEMEAATVNSGTICKIVKEGIIKQPLTEATSIKSILLNNVIEMAKSNTNSAETRWESADGTEYFAIYGATGLTGVLYPSRKMIKYYSAVENGGFEIYYDHDGDAYITLSLNEPYLIEFSNPLTLVTNMGHSDISALIYSTIPTEVLTNIFEFKDDEYIELIGTPKPYESIEDMEADAITPEITAVVYDKSSDTFMGIYEATEFGWRILSGQLTTTANTIAPGFIGYGPDGIVNGTFTTDATASASDILEGQTAYINGQKVIGNIQSTYITTDGVASPLYENSWTGNTSYRTMAFSHKFGIALIRTTTTKKTESLRIAKVNKETGAYSMASSSHDITNSQLIGVTGYSFVGADIAHQLNEDGTLRMVFVLSTLSTTVYNRDAYIVACDYDLSTYTIKKIYKPSFGLVDLDYSDRDVNATPVIFSPINKDVFLVVDTISNSTSSSGTYDIPGWLTNHALALCFIQPSGDILLRSCGRNGNVNHGEKSQRIAWSPDGTRIWWNAGGLYPSSYTDTSYNSSSICEINYDSASVTTTVFKNKQYGHMVFLNENTLFELKYDKTYNIYSTNGKSLTKIKSGTIDMIIYYKTGSSYLDDNITELRCVDNNIFYVDSQNFYCITLDNDYNVINVQALDSKYCCLFDVQETSPYLNRKCLVTKVEDGKYIHCSDANQYYAVFQITGNKVIETINKDGVTLHNTSSATATSSNILINKSAYVDGGKISGSMPNNGSLVYDPGDNAMSIPLGYTSGGTVKAADITKLYEYDVCDNIASDILAYPRVLPEGFELLDYIESTGKQYISLSDWYTPNFSTSDNFDIIADIQFIDIPTIPFASDVNSYNINGVRGSSNIFSSSGTYLYFGYTTSGVTGDDGTYPVLCYSPGMQGTDYKTTVPVDSRRHIYKIISDPNKNDVGFWVDDQQLDNRGSTLNLKDFQRPFNICGYKSSVGTVYGVKQRVFRFKILNNDGTLLYDLIPARRKSDNAIGLYDLVKGTFYSNAGSGSFLYKLTDTGIQPKLNVYTQLTEPHSKNGIWFAKECSITNIIADRNVLATEDWNTEKMSTIGSMAHSLAYGGCAAVGDNIYLFGGTSNYRKATRYTPANNTYTALAEIPYDFYYGCCAAVGENIYLFGGGGGNKTAYKYNPRNNVYTRIANPTNYIRNTAIAVSDTNIYLLGNSTTSGARTVLQYDTLTDTYTTITALPVDFGENYAAVVGSYIYAFYGTAIYRKTLTGTSWTKLSLTVPTTTKKGNCLVVGNIIYLFGSSSYENFAYKYDTSAGTITRIDDIPYEFYAGGCALVGTNIYLLGGYPNGTRVQILTATPKEYPNGSLVISQDNALNKSTNLIDVDIPNLVTYYDRIYYKDGNGDFQLASPLYNGNGSIWTKVQ